MPEFGITLTRPPKETGLQVCATCAQNGISFQGDFKETSSFSTVPLCPLLLNSYSTQFFTYYKMPYTPGLRDPLF